MTNETLKIYNNKLKDYLGNNYAQIEKNLCLYNKEIQLNYLKKLLNYYLLIDINIFNNIIHVLKEMKLESNNKLLLERNSLLLLLTGADLNLLLQLRKIDIKDFFRPTIFDDDYNSNYRFLLFYTDKILENSVLKRQINSEFKLIFQQEKN